MIHRLTFVRKLEKTYPGVCYHNLLMETAYRIEGMEELEDLVNYLENAN